MADVQVIDFEALPWTPDYGAPFAKVTGDYEAKSANLEGYSLWALMARFEEGASITWQSEHGDEVIAVLSGGLEVEGAVVPRLGSLVLEAGTPLTATATGTTMLLHYGSVDPTPPVSGPFGPAAARQEGDPGYHVHGPLGRENRSMEFEGELLESAFHADSTCKTCRPTLLRVSARGPMKFPSHYHSEDELIFVVDGAFQSGPLKAKAGTMLAIPSGRRYGIRSDEAFEFFNYRRDVSTIVIRSEDDAKLEIAEGRGYVPSPALA
jgi:quercetin dioxygenase-like cupin family protein